MLPPCSLTLLDNRTGFHIEGRGRPVVLLHSSLGSKGQWRALVERMRRSHRLIAIDLHGYGGTPMPNEPASFGLRDEIALIDSVLRVGLLPGERLHLVGHAYGASVDDAVEKLQYDLYYVNNHSLFMDLMILLATVEVVLWGKGAR